MPDSPRLELTQRTRSMVVGTALLLGVTAVISVIRTNQALDAARAAEWRANEAESRAMNLENKVNALTNRLNLLSVRVNALPGH